jgi:uncharacterized lipoprotein YddW (UPF0748 family)
MANQVTDLVNKCRTYDFNGVVVQMRRRGDAFYFPQTIKGAKNHLDRLKLRCFAANDKSMS